MIKSIASGEALRKTYQPQVSTFIFSISIAGTYLVERVGLDLRELVLHVVGVHGSDLFTSRSAKHFDDLNKLIDAGFAREEGLAKHQLCHDTASRPNICICVSHTECTGKGIEHNIPILVV